MDKQECVCNVSKAGPNLFVRIPIDKKEKISRGDRVKVILIEKALPKDKTKLKQIITEFVKNPNGEKLKGTMSGFSFEIPFVRIISVLTQKKAEKMIYEAMQK